MELKDYTEQALKAELARRQIAAPPPPPLNSDPDWEPVIRTAQAHFDAIKGDDYCEDNDDAHYIYEAVMTALYGEAFWPWLQSRT